MNFSKPCGQWAGGQGSGIAQFSSKSMLVPGQLTTEVSFFGKQTLDLVRWPFVPHLTLHEDHSDQQLHVLASRDGAKKISSIERTHSARNKVLINLKDCYHQHKVPGSLAGLHQS